MKTEQGRIIEVPEAVSTFDEAKNLGTTDEGVAIFTRIQKAAIGRLQPLKSGCLWFTSVVYPRQSATTSPLLMLTTALSVVEGIARTTGLQPLLRWPNEVSLHGYRVAAVSVEMDVVNDLVARAFAGGGVYCNVKSEEIPAGFRNENTSISAELGAEVDEVKLLENILENFRKEYELYKAGWRLELIEKIRDVMEYIRTTVNITLSHGTQLIGFLEDLDELGRISFRVDQERILLAPADVESMSVL
ncbi:MAG: hypothetical protein QXU87_08265 [Candidatus Caldarchaeum sp.]